MAANRLMYNPDSSYNEMYYTSEGELKISAEEYRQAEKLYCDVAKRDGIHEAWNSFHTKEWNYTACEEWCAEYSANHRF